MQQGEKSLQLRSTSKINLLLEILYRRVDGYHQVHTVLQELAFSDIVELKDISGNEIIFYCNREELPPKEGNLAYEAASLLKSLYAPRRGVEITLYKHIPVSAGLGGGSSNAAAVLKGLNKLWGLSLQEKHLLEIAARLGSDVPFFLFGGTAAAEGRGEIITPLPDFPSSKVLLVIPPGAALSTKRVYNSLSLEKIRRSAVNSTFTRQFIRRLHAVDKTYPGWGENLTDLFINQMEQAVFKLETEVKFLKERLLKENVAALVSGSGPTVFALTREEGKLAELQDKLSSEGYTVILTETKTAQQSRNFEEGAK